MEFEEVDVFFCCLGCVDGGLVVDFVLEVCCLFFEGGCFEGESGGGFEVEFGVFGFGVVVVVGEVEVGNLFCWGGLGVGRGRGFV